MPFKPCGASDTDYLRPTRILKSDVFRLAAVFAFLFLALTGILIGTVLFIVEGTQRSALASANDADIATVTNGFLDEGVPEAVEVVRQRLGSSHGGRALRPDVYMVIENDSGEKLAGNLPALPPKSASSPSTCQIQPTRGNPWHRQRKSERRPFWDAAWK